MKIRVIALLCAIMMLATLFVACSDTTDDPKDTTTSSDGTTVPGGQSDTTVPGGEDDPYAGQPKDENGFVLDDLPSDLSFAGKDGPAVFSIFSWKPTYPEWSDGENGEVIDNSLYFRDLNVEERLGIDIVLEQIDGSNHYRTEFLKRVSTLINGGDQTYDLISQYSWVSGNATLQGLYLDINSTEYINFNKPWWPSDIVQNSRIDDKVYFVTGDIAPSMIFATFITLFNQKLITDLGLEDPYTLVNNKQWTLDKLIEMTVNVFTDSDSSGTPTGGDTIGFSFWADTHTKPFMYGSGLRAIEVNNDGEYIVSPLYTGQKMQDLVDKMNSWIFEHPGITLTDNDATNGGAGDGGLFGTGCCLFGEYDIYYMAYYLPNFEVTYGVVPTPMYDATQDQYYSFYGNAITTFSIPTTALSRADRSSAVLEALASESYRTATPAIFQTAVKEKYSPNPEATVMLQLIHDTIVTDIAPFYTDNLLGYNEMRTILSDSMTSWASIYGGVKIMLGKAVKNLNTKLMALEY